MNKFFKTIPVVILTLILSSCDSSPKKPSDVVKKAVDELCKKKDFTALHNYYHPDEAALIKQGAKMMGGLNSLIESAMSPSEKAAYKQKQFSFCEKPITILSEKIEGNKALIITSDQSKYLAVQIKGKWYLTTR